MGVVGTWQATGHSVPHSLYWVIALTALFVAFFKAWNDERKAKEAAIARLGEEQGKQEQSQGISDEHWLELSRQKMKLEDELETLEHPPGGVGSAIRFMTPSEMFDSIMRSRKTKRIKEHLELINERLLAARPLER